MVSRESLPSTDKTLTTLTSIRGVGRLSNRFMSSSEDDRNSASSLDDGCACTRSPEASSEVFAVALASRSVALSPRSPAGTVNRASSLAMLSVIAVFRGSCRSGGRISLSLLEFIRESKEAHENLRRHDFFFSGNRSGFTKRFSSRTRTRASHLRHQTFGHPLSDEFPFLLILSSSFHDHALLFRKKTETGESRLLLSSHSHYDIGETESSEWIDSSFCCCYGRFLVLDIGMGSNGLNDKRRHMEIIQTHGFGKMKSKSRSAVLIDQDDSDNVYSIYAVYGLALAYQRLDEDNGRACKRLVLFTYYNVPVLKDG